jgi:hypothetical protein
MKASGLGPQASGLGMGVGLRPETALRPEA